MNASISEQELLDELAGTSVIDATACARVRAAQEGTGERVCKLLPRLGLIEEGVLAGYLVDRLAQEPFNDTLVPAEPIAPELLGGQFLRNFGILPLRIDAEHILIATADPFDDYALKAVALASRRPVRIAIGEHSRIERFLQLLYGEGGTCDVQADFDDDADDGDLQRLRDQASEAPVIRVVNRLIQAAVEMRASDIHVEPFHQTLQVRYRVDGVLREVAAPAAGLKAAVVSRIKVMARLDIAERRLPQDGRIRTTVGGKEIDLRISTFPTLHGESVVIRILDRFGVRLDLKELGLGAPALAYLTATLRKPTGLVLVTGPTGSGKTTTLYAALLHLNRQEQKIFTIEDPIEYELGGINQTQVKPQIGLSFASALRSIMRQDPDAILVGEIRDLETAEIAAQSALTGHKVFSTLHTNDAVGAIARLKDMGLPTFLINATLECVVAQRLLRVLCPSCKVRVPSASSSAAASAPEPEGVRCQPVGCPECGGLGFRGRIGIYEILKISPAMRQLIHENAPESELRRVAVADGMISMREDGLRHVALGMTTVLEVDRVTRES